MTKELRIDKRGRVRFAAQGYRFEITKSGLSVYDRRGGTRMFEPMKVEEREVSYNFRLSTLKNPTLLLIAEAVMLVNGKLGSATLVNTNA